jgi:MOSC domain-containing protein YiiM
VSVNVGLPREVEWRGRRVRTGIWKEPVAGPVRVGRLNLEGDGQADSLVHGGAAKAVYVYPAEHYELWRAELDMPDLGWGGFGENLTTIGLSEEIMRIGDRLRIGTAAFQVTRPRLPCYKLAIRIDRPGIERRFLQTGRTGFYLSVVLEGHVAAGDAIEFEASSEKGPTVAEIVTQRRADEEA